MAWDLKLSKYGDLLFAANRDVVTTSGGDLLQQRVFLRLKIARGSWVFDEEGDLGSQLDLALQVQKPEGMLAIPSLVNDALEPISEEIQLVDVEVRESSTDERAIDLILTLAPLISPEITSSPLVETPQLKLTVPIVPASGV